ncbi:MAG: hypothetical protein HOW73_47870 [Polyangiaceae bacterium]|nr:hypothetical protein [Polyangiaceae bacterium]
MSAAIAAACALVWREYMLDRTAQDVAGNAVCELVIYEDLGEPRDPFLAFREYILLLVDTNRAICVRVDEAARVMAAEYRRQTTLEKVAAA